MKVVQVAIAAALMTMSGAAAAQTATEARCIILSDAFSKQASDANAKKLAEASLYFYLGRITGQPTAAQVKAIFDQQAKTLTDATAGPMMNECIKPVQARLELLQSLSGPPPAQTKPATPQGR